MLGEDKKLNDLYSDWTSLEKQLDETDFVMMTDSKEIDADTLNTVVAQLKKRDLSKLKTAEDVIKAVDEMIPGSQISAVQRAEIKTRLETFLRNETIKGYGKMGLALALTAGAWYFGGPMADMAARSIFTKAYGMMFGIPSKMSLSYWTAFAPLRSHVGNFAYRYGAPMLTSVAGPVLYAATAATKYVGRKVVGAGSYLLSQQKQTDDVRLKATAVTISDTAENKEAVASRQFLRRTI